MVVQYLREICNLLQSYFFIFFRRFSPWIVEHCCTLSSLSQGCFLCFLLFTLLVPLCLLRPLSLSLSLYLSGFLAHRGVFQSAMNGELKLHGTFRGPSAHNLSAWSPAMPGQCLLMRSVLLVHIGQDFMALARYAFPFSLFHDVELSSYRVQNQLVWMKNGLCTTEEHWARKTSSACYRVLIGLAWINLKCCYYSGLNNSRSVRITIQRRMWKVHMS